MSEFSVGAIRPVLPFLMFSTSSSLLPENFTHSQRAIYYAIFLTLYKVGSALSNPIFGVISDLFGRKIVFYISVISMLILGFCATLAIFTNNIALFIIGSFFFGLLWAERAVATAAINDVSTSSAKITNLSMMQFFVGIGVCLGPIVGGYLGGVIFYGYSYVTPYIFLFLVSLVLLFYVHYAIRETYSGPNVKSITMKRFPLKRVKVVLHDKKIYFLLLICVLCQLSWGAYYEYIPVVAKTAFGYNVKHIGLLASMIGISIIFTTGFLLPLLNKYCRKFQLIKLSCFIGFIGTISCFIFSFYPHLLIADIAIWVSILPIVAGDVMVFCVLIALFSEVVSKDLQGTIVGVVYVVASIMWIIGAALGGVLLHWRLNGPLIIGPISMAILLFLLLIFSREMERLISGKKK
ncbi:MAG: MFS transporter [bacterium]|nr:MFS transporter [bacterium]